MNLSVFPNKGFNKLAKYLATSSVGDPMVTIGLNGQPSLCTLGNPYILGGKNDFDFKTLSVSLLPTL